MPSRYNPFRPGSIVTPGMFCGRYEEFVGTEKALFQTKHGNPQHFLIHGERGIGKSSLLYSLDLVARNAVASFEDEKFNFLTLAVGRRHAIRLFPNGKGQPFGGLYEDYREAWKLLKEDDSSTNKYTSGTQEPSPEMENP
jgi:hypothetical protein